MSFIIIIIIIISTSYFSFFPLFPAVMKVCCGAVKTIKGALAFCLVVALFNQVIGIFRFGVDCEQVGSNCIGGGVGVGVGVLLLITLRMLRRKMVWAKFVLRFNCSCNTTETGTSRIQRYDCRLQHTKTLKFKSQLALPFFSPDNHLSRPLRKQKLSSASSKVRGLWFVIGGFRSILWFSVFPGTLIVILIMIDGSAGKTQL